MISLLLIPICSLLDHLGGQSTTIPDPRIVCRVILIPLAFAVATYLSGFPIETVALYWVISTLSFALWACLGWASGFCCIPPYNDGRQDTWLSDLVNDIMNVNYLTKLTQSQCWKWGVIYFTLRGMYLYPLFCMLAVLNKPWAMAIGLGCSLMGVVYGNCKTVLLAEYIYGSIIGAMLAAVLMI